MVSDESDDAHAIPLLSFLRRVGSLETLEAVIWCSGFSPRLLRLLPEAASDAVKLISSSEVALTSHLSRLPACTLYCLSEKLIEWQHLVDWLMDWPSRCQSIDWQHLPGQLK